MTAIEERPDLTDDAPVGSTIETGPLGPARIPASRYTSPAWAALEAERLWPTTWQIAATRGQVAEPGDWVEYRCGPLSVLIVRGDDGELRAFQNVCLHRGNELCEGDGPGLHRASAAGTTAGPGTSRASCARSRPARASAPLRNDDLPLVPVPGRTPGDRAGLRQPRPRRRAAATTTSRACPRTSRGPASTSSACRRYLAPAAGRATGRSCIEAFSETYHVQGIHREMLALTDDVNSPQRLWNRHGKLVPALRHPVAPPAGRRHRRRRSGAASSRPRAPAWASTDPRRRPVPPVPEGSTMRDVIEQRVAGRGAEQGRRPERLRHRAGDGPAPVQPLPEHHRHLPERRARA